MPKVSVIIPIYNTKEEYLREAIESILNQTFQDFELLAIDNGSQSNIKQIIKSYDDQRIKYIRCPTNIGPANARNKGIEQASGEYVAFLDSDDISLPERLEKQIDFLEKHLDVGCLGTNFSIITNTGEKSSEVNSFSHSEIEKRMVFVGCSMTTSTIMLRKKLLDDDHVRFNPQYVPAEDYEMWTQFIGKTHFAVLEMILSKYRWHENNTSLLQAERQRDKANLVMIHALEKYCQFPIIEPSRMAEIYQKGFSRDEDVEIFNKNFLSILKALRDKNISESEIYTFLGKRFKKIYYKTKKRSQQIKLLTSPLNKEMHIPLYWRITYFMTRIIL